MKNLNAHLVYAAVISSLFLFISPLRATTCANAIPITTFPVINQALVCGTDDDLSATTVPAVCNNIPNTYKGGSEALYTFTPSSSGTYFISYYGKFLTSIFVYNGCPTAGGNCLQAVGSSPQHKALAVSLTAGVAYYIWFDVWTGSIGPCAATFSITASMLNDDCVGAVAFPPFSLTSTSVTASTLGAIGTPDPVCAGIEDDDVWFTFTTPPGITALTYNTDNVINGDENLVVQLFQGTCSNLSAIGCYDPDSGVLNGLSGNTTYYLRAYTKATGSSSTFDIRLTIQGPPENDNCSGALPFPSIPTNGDCSTLFVSTTNATGTVNATCTGQEDDDVWYTFTTPEGYTFVQYSIASSSGSSDRVLEVFSATCNELISIGCYDPESGSITGLSPNTTYYLRIFTKSSGVSSSFSLCLFILAPANDFCSGAIVFPVLPADGSCAVVTVSTENATGASNDTSCWGLSDDDVWCSFTTPPGVTYLRYNNVDISGDSNRELQVLQGSCNDLTAIGCYSSESGIIYGLTGNTTYYIRVYTSSFLDVSTFQICLRLPLANDNCTGAFPFPPIPLDNSCASVTAITATATSSSGNSNSQDPCGGYSDDDVWFTFITPEDITALFYRNTNISGSADRVIEVLEGTCAGLVSKGCYGPESGLISGLTGNTTYYLRVYTAELGYHPMPYNSFNICLNVPLPNDNCTGATAFPVIPPGGDCATVSAATTLATGSSTADCGGVPDDDVWFSFLVPSGTTTLEYNIVPISGSTDMVIRLYRGSCTTNVGCFDAESGSFTALIPNTIYYLKIFTKESGAHSVFDFCLKRVPALANDICAGAIAIPNLPPDGSCVMTNISTISATGLTDATCVGAEDDDVWYTFTTPPGHTAVYYGMNTVSGSSNRVLRVYKGTCPSSLTSVGCYDDEGGTITGLTGNTTYYIRVYTYETGTVSIFNLCLGVVPRPVNDDCSGAIAFPELPLDGSCSMVTVTTEGATGVTSATCTGAEDDDVWYTFNTPPGVTSLAYDFFKISGSTNRAFQVFLGNCSGLMSVGCYNPAMGGFISGLDGGTTYYLRAYTQASGEASTFQLCLYFTPPPPNDACTGAAPFPDIPVDGSGSTVTYTTFGATGIPDNTCQGVEDDDVWLSFTAPPGVTSLLYNYTHIAGDCESHFQLYSGDCNNLTLVGCHYELTRGTITGLNGGSTYYIRVYTRLSNVAGTFKLTLKTVSHNDECINAIPFPDFPSDDGCSQVNFSMSNASPSVVPGGLACSVVYVEDLWYSFSVPPGVTYLHYQMDGEFPSNPHFQIFSGECSSLTSIGCFNPGEGVISGLSSGVVYYMRAFEFDPYYFKNLSICLRLPPPNDNCSGAIALPLPTDGSCVPVAVNTIAATGTSDETCGGLEDDDVWYTFTTPPGVTRLFYHVSNVVTSNELYFQLFSGNDCSSLTPLGCYRGLAAELNGLSENTTYYLRTYTSSAGIAAFDLCLRVLIDNDECSNAIAFPDLSTDGNCATIVASTGFATGTQNPACSGGEDDDIWYTFTTPSEMRTISYEILTISSDTDREFQVFSGECGNLTSLGCYDPERGILSGLSTNTTYYLRIYTFYNGDSSIFSMCLQTHLVNDNCEEAIAFPTIPVDGSCALVTANTTYATGTPDPTCFGFETDDVWFSFTTPPGMTSIAYENITISGSTNRLLQLFSGACGNLTSLGCYDLESGVMTGLNDNTTYFLRAYTPSSIETGVFDICLRAPASNDECSDAIAFPVIPTDGSCATLNISTKFATGSSDPTCAGTEDDDVWYTFTTPSGVTSLAYQGDSDLSNVYFQVFSGSCGSATSIGCFASPNGNITGLVGNTTYYIRAYTSLAEAVHIGNLCLRLSVVNDACSGAIPFPTLPSDGSCAAVSSFATGVTSSINFTCGGGEEEDIWFTFTTPPNVTHLRYEINSISGDYFPDFQVLTGSCGNFISVGCHYGYSGIISGLTGNTTYYLRTFNSEASFNAAFSICLKLTFSNDDCANAILIDGCNNSIQGSFLGATADGVNNDCVVNIEPATKGVWYRMVGDGLPVMLHTCLDSDSRSGIIVYSGSCGSQVCVTGNTGACSSGSQVSWVSAAGEEYYIFVYSIEVNSYDFTLSVVGGEQCPSAIGQTTVSIDTMNTGATISWPTIAGIENYEYILTTSGSCSTGTVQTTTSNSISFPELEPNTQYTFCLRSNCSCYETGFASLSFTTPPCEEPLGMPWTVTDIGGAAGTAINNYCGGTIDISSDGVSASSANDVRLFAFQNFCDTVAITAKVNHTTTGDFAGIVLRENTTAGARMIALKSKGTKYVYLEVRSIANGSKQTQQFLTSNHRWLRMVRNGDQIIGYSSGNGVHWQQHFAINLALPSCIDAGLFAESTQAGASAVGAFSNVSIVPSTSTIVLPNGEFPTEENPTEGGGTTPDYFVYPNPTESAINVKMGRAFTGKELTITIINQLGQMMANRKIREVQELTETFDVRQFPPGVYIITLSTESGGRLATKFIVGASTGSIRY